jgi:hypothetical protein
VERFNERAREAGEQDVTRSRLDDGEIWGQRCKRYCVAEVQASG